MKILLFFYMFFVLCTYLSLVKSAEQQIPNNGQKATCASYVYVKRIDDDNDDTKQCTTDEQESGNNNGGRDVGDNGMNNTGVCKGDPIHGSCSTSQHVIGNETGDNNDAAISKRNIGMVMHTKKTQHSTDYKSETTLGDNDLNTLKGDDVDDDGDSCDDNVIDKYCNGSRKSGHDKSCNVRNNFDRSDGNNDIFFKECNDNTDECSDNTDECRDNTDECRDNTDEYSDNSNEYSNNADENSDNSNENSDNSDDCSDNSNENSDNSNENSDNSNENSDNSNENSDNSNENSDNSNANSDNSNENSDNNSNSNDADQTPSSQNANSELENCFTPCPDCGHMIFHPSFFRFLMYEFQRYYYMIVAHKRMCKKKKHYISNISNKEKRILRNINGRSCKVENNNDRFDENNDTSSSESSDDSVDEQDAIRNSTSGQANRNPGVCNCACANCLPMLFDPGFIRLINYAHNHFHYLLLTHRPTCADKTNYEVNVRGKQPFVNKKRDDTNDNRCDDRTNSVDQRSGRSVHDDRDSEHDSNYSGTSSRYVNENPSEDSSNNDSESIRRRRNRCRSRRIWASNNKGSIGEPMRRPPQLTHNANPSRGHNRKNSTKQRINIDSSSSSDTDENRSKRGVNNDCLVFETKYISSSDNEIVPPTHYSNSLESDINRRKKKSIKKKDYSPYTIKNNFELVSDSCGEEIMKMVAFTQIQIKWLALFTFLLVIRCIWEMYQAA